MADARAALTAARLPLLTFHQALIQAERRRYEATHGALTPVQLLQELLNAEAFAWLKPMTAQILSIDERLDDQSTPSERFVESVGNLRELLKPSGEVAQRVAALLSDTPGLATLNAAVLDALGPLN